MKETNIRNYTICVHVDFSRPNEGFYQKASDVTDDVGDSYSILCRRHSFATFSREETTFETFEMRRDLKFIPEQDSRLLARVCNNQIPHSFKVLLQVSCLAHRHHWTAENVHVNFGNASSYTEE